MFEEFSRGYYLGRLYIEPHGGDRAVINRDHHELVNEQLYTDDDDPTRIEFSVRHTPFDPDPDTALDVGFDADTDADTDVHTDDGSDHEAPHPDHPLVMKLGGHHFAVGGAIGIPENTLALPEPLLERSRIRNPPALREVLLAKADRAKQLLQWFGIHDGSTR